MIPSTLQSESVAANCPSSKAASLWLSEQQELWPEQDWKLEWTSFKSKIINSSNPTKFDRECHPSITNNEKKGSFEKEKKKWKLSDTSKNHRDNSHLNNPMTGCRAPARRTSFFIFGEEWTKFPITPTW